MSADAVLYLARGIEDLHYWVVQELDGPLIETPWRIEHEVDGYRLSHADDRLMTELVYGLGASESPEDAVDNLRAFL